MFSFSKIRNYFTDSPIARAELAYLQRQSRSQRRWLRWPGYILFACAVLLALVPTVLTMYDQPRVYIILPIIIAAIFLVHFGVMIRTLTLASHTIAREKETNNWDALVLTGQDARQIILAKFWAVMRCVWVQHTLAALLKLGLAYGLAQYFFFVTNVGCIKHIGPGVCSTYYNVSDDYFNYYGYWPFITHILIAGGGMLVAWGLLEAALLTGLGIFMSLLNTQRRIIGVTGAVAVRAIMILLTMTLWTAITQKDRALYDAVRFGSTGGFMMGLTSQGIVMPVEWHQLLGMVQLVPSSLADDGVILTALTFRPYPPISVYARLLIAMGAGMGLFLVFILTALKSAQFLAVRQSALRPAAENQPSSTMMRTPTG